MGRAKLYNQYKRHYAITVLISCTHLGAINYISKCYGERVSGIQITSQPGFTNCKYHVPGEQILAYSGFIFEFDFAACSSLLILGFIRGKS